MLLAEMHMFCWKWNILAVSYNVRVELVGYSFNCSNICL